MVENVTVNYILYGEGPRNVSLWRQLGRGDTVLSYLSLSAKETGTVIVTDVRNFNLICVLQNPVRADFQPLIADTRMQNGRICRLRSLIPTGQPVGLQ